MATTEELLKGLILSASELRELTDWPEALIEDYLNLIRNLFIVAEATDTGTTNTANLDQQVQFIQARLSKLNVLIKSVASLKTDVENILIDISNNTQLINTFDPRINRNKAINNKQAKQIKNIEQLVYVG